MPTSEMAKELQAELIRKQHLVEMLSKPTQDPPDANGNPGAVRYPVMMLRGPDGQDYDAAPETLQQARQDVQKLQQALSQLGASGAPEKRS